MPIRAEPPEDCLAADVIAEDFRSVARPFRGEIYEDDVDLQEQDVAEFLQCHFHRPIFRVLNRPTTRRVFIRAANQIGKSRIGELTLKHKIKHDPGDMILYDIQDEMSKDHMKTRFMRLIKSIPEIASIIAEIEADNRFDVTTQDIQLPGMVLRGRALNEQWTQRITIRYGLISDAALAGRNGQIRRAFIRSTQYEGSDLWIVESQGGEKDDDFTTQMATTDEAELWVVCPLCGSAQKFAWHAERVESQNGRGSRDESREPEFQPSTLDPRPSTGFQAVLPRAKAETLKTDKLKEEARAELTALLLKPENRHAGMKRGDEALIKLPDGSYNEAEILRQTYYECFHCGSAWRDDGNHGVTRRFLDRSVHYVPTRTNAAPGYYGFTIPKWINPRISWGSCMLNYLQAKHADDQLGNKMPMQEWVQKWCGLTWTDDYSQRPPEKLPLSLEYDTKAKIPGELGRIASVDFQFNGTHMIYQAWAIGDGVPPRLLHYEWIKPRVVGLPDAEAREYCKNRVRELNKQFGIEQQNLMIDAAHRPDLVREWAAEDHVLARIKSGQAVRQKIITYCLLMGDDRLSYRWEHPGRKHTLERFKRKEPAVLVDIVTGGKRMRVPVQHQLWSNPSIKQIAVRWRDGDGAPKIEVHERYLKDGSKEGFWAQMNAERLLPWKGRPGKFRWDNEGRPNHGFDGFCMVMVRMDQLGLLNSFGPPEEEEV